jgi:UDP-N-acetylglucosamine acyltransferase
VARIHPTAVVDPGAKLAEDVSIGAYTVIGPDVELGPGVALSAHVLVVGCTTIGPRTRVFPFAALGGEPQDKKFSGEATRLSIGADNVIREHVTLHVGTVKGGGVTRIGDDNLIMNGVHVGHDGAVGSHCILASFTALAGHVVVEDFAVLGGYTGVHQFTRIGESVMAAAGSMVAQDAPPFAMVAGDRARLVGLNAIGLKRRGFSDETRAAIKQAYQIVFHSKLLTKDALQRVREELAHCPEALRLADFLEGSERGFVRR